MSKSILDYFNWKVKGWGDYQGKDLTITLYHKDTGLEISIH